MEFEWDAKKEEGNIKKHGISFITAAEVLLQEHYLARSDRQSEIRYLAIGQIKNCILAVVYTRRKNKYRIISVRRARKNEEAAYKKHRKLSST